MNSRRLFLLIAVIAWSAGFWMASLQRNEISRLRAEREHLLSESKHGPGSGTSSKPVRLEPLQPPPPELLQLRGEVARLMAAPRDLHIPRVINEQLRSEWAVRQASAPPDLQLPPGYILSSEAQWMGLGSPEDAVQSFLWAYRNADFERLLATMTPESAEQFAATFRKSDQSMEQFRGRARRLPGMRIVNQQLLPDGSIQATIEIEPGKPAERSVWFRLIEGEWRLDMPL